MRAEKTLCRPEKDIFFRYGSAAVAPVCRLFLYSQLRIQLRNAEGVYSDPVVCRVRAFQAFSGRDHCADRLVVGVLRPGGRRKAALDFGAETRPLRRKTDRGTCLGRRGFGLAKGLIPQKKKNHRKNRLTHRRDRRSDGGSRPDLRRRKKTPSERREGRKGK